MKSFRFLHAADIHLDSPLTGLSRYEGLPADEIRGATRAAFGNLIQYGLDAAVDFVVLAGDLFDGDWRDMATGLHFARQMGRLDQAGIPVFLLLGNHDAASVVTKSLPWPPNVHRFGSRQPQTFEIDALDVALHGWSFANQSAPDNLAARYPDAQPGRFNIGVLHTSLSGRPGHAAYAPCGLADLRARGYDYWALGHVHAFERVGDDPPIVFPGNVQGRSIRETGAKGAVVVEVEDGIVSSVERIELDVLRWAAVAVDCGGCTTMDAVQERLRFALAAARGSAAAGRGLVARVTLEGETPLSPELADGIGRLRDDARAHAGAIAPDLWIEKLRVTTTAPEAAGGPDADADLEALLAAAPDDELRAALAAELQPFVDAARAAGAADPEAEDLRRAADIGDWTRVAAAAAAGLRARLGAG